MGSGQLFGPTTDLQWTMNQHRRPKCASLPPSYQHAEATVLLSELSSNTTFLPGQFSLSIHLGFLILSSPAYAVYS